MMGEKVLNVVNNTCVRFVTAHYLVSENIPPDKNSLADEAYHDLEAEKYDNHLLNEPTRSTEDWISRFIVDEVKAGIVLDIGSGTGRLTSLLIGPKNIVFSVDRSSNMLAIASKQVEHSNHYILRADARCLPFFSGSCDTIIFSGVLHHIQDWRSALIEAFRVLKPKGRIIIREPNLGYPVRSIGYVEEAIKRLSNTLFPVDEIPNTWEAWTAAPYEEHLLVEDIVSAFPAGTNVRLATTAMHFASLDIPSQLKSRDRMYRLLSRLDTFVFGTHFAKKYGALLLISAEKSPASSLL